MLESHAVSEILREIGQLSFLDQATLIGGYLPGAAAAQALNTMQADRDQLNRLLNAQPQPAVPGSAEEWDDPSRVKRFHAEIDAMILSAYADWKPQ